MEFTLLCNLGGPKKESVVLRLRLLHMWAVKAPGDVRVFNFCTLWVDKTGMLIHGLSPAAMASGIRQALRVDKIYMLKTFCLSNPPNLYRACSFDLALGITPSTSFHECHLPAPSFTVEAYEFQPFARLLSRADVIGRLHSISGVSHKITNNGPAVKQTVVLENESGEKVTITLWDEFSRIIDHVALTQADAIETVVLAFGELLVNRLAGGFALSNSAATHVSVNPQVLEAYRFAQRFAETREVVGSLPIEFATTEEATADAERRTRTLAQLTDLALTNASLDERHRCGGVIMDVESHVPCVESLLQFEPPHFVTPMVIL
ncbi:unnamed protein product [Linum trigynum]|uniref:Replication protein A OB domain-containing protein n=1 Tax=Linum trigynum TaxID=586398 RepID=A0AAV2FTN0_9ROSI